VTARSAAYVTNTSLLPAAKFTKEPELLDSSTVVRVSVLPEDEYVPMPTSHAFVAASTMAYVVVLLLPTTEND
jgi:hypothetical protein